MNPDYPYPTFDEDGFDLELIEQDQAEGYDFPLPNFPSDEERFAVEKGNVVKLIFRYKDPIKLNGQAFSLERMWVEMIESKETHIVGRLDNSPQYTNRIKSDDLVNFHPKHIISFWKD